ncbi:MAG: hypothetical protein KatS3mg023_0476 [Armatimonadota bacterium]|nr:MAG: hypothetical protein KatS3mg023_0476 [Armatimonadota bacterium]
MVPLFSLGSLVSGLFKGPLLGLGLSLLPNVLGIGKSAGKKASGYEQQMADAAEVMKQQAMNLPRPTPLASRTWNQLAAQAMRAQVQAPPGVTLPGANELLRAAMLARAQAATAQQELADQAALRDWYAQRAALMSGLPNIYQQLAAQYRQQQAGQLAGWGQMLSTILSRMEPPDPRMQAVQAIGRFLRGR